MTDDQPTQNDCDHAYASHLRGGEPLYVRICMLCCGIDWPDLRTQVDALTDAAFHNGLHQAVAGVEPEIAALTEPT